MVTYVELQVTSHFSFLRGASSPDELFAAAALQGHSALGVADRGSVAGLVRAWEAQKATGVRLIPGARVDLTDGRALLLYPTDKAAWSRPTQLLTLGKSRAGKGGCTLDWSDVVAWNDGLIAILLPLKADAVTARHLIELRATFADRGYLGLAFRRRPDDALRLHELSAQATAAHVATVAVGDILYHAPEARLLQDVVTAIREKCTVDTLGFRRERHADRHLKSPDEMERRFTAFPDAIHATAEIAARCTFDLAQLSYQYPDERVVDGLTAQGALEQLTHTAVERMFPDEVPDAYVKQISHELTLIGELGYDSCWMKHHHPDVFCTALLNAQPMGFYTPAQVVRDAREHGVEVRPACINASRWDCTLEPARGRYLAVRLGLRQVRGLANAHGASIVTARGAAPFQSVEEVWRRGGVPRAAIERLAEADAFHALGEDRRQGLWKVKGLGETPLPLFAAADRREAAFSPEGLEPDVSLRPLSEGREVVEDYRALQLSLRAHPLAFLRPDLTRRGIVRCADLAHVKDGR